MFRVDLFFCSFSLVVSIRILDLKHLVRLSSNAYPTVALLVTLLIIARNIIPLWVTSLVKLLPNAQVIMPYLVNPLVNLCLYALPMSLVSCLSGLSSHFLVAFGHLVSPSYLVVPLVALLSLALCPSIFVFALFNPSYPVSCLLTLVSVDLFLVHLAPLYPLLVTPALPIVCPCLVVCPFLISCHLISLRVSLSLVHPRQLLVLPLVRFPQLVSLCLAVLLPIPRPVLSSSLTVMAFIV
jgi:hypothetical protein